MLAKCRLSYIHCNLHINIDSTRATNISTINLEEKVDPYGLSFCKGSIYVADHALGVYTYDMETHQRNQIVDPARCKTPHDICIVGDDIIYTDPEKHAIYRVGGCVANNIELLIGTEVPGQRDGHSGIAQFAQPTGICAEGNTLFIVDTATGSLKIITSVVPLCRYLLKSTVPKSFWYT